MEGIFQEFENENELRSYPFAAGCVPAEGESYIPSSVFVDASIYPVNPSGTIFLSGISSDGTFSLSDDTGVIMKGSPAGKFVELYDLTPMRRHVGTIVASSEDALEEFSNRGVDRSYSSRETSFASSCTFPVVVDGVVGVSSGDSDPVCGIVSFSNGPSDDIRVSSGTDKSGRKTLRFDILPRPAPREDSSIKRIICVVDGKTPFRIEKLFDKDNPEKYGYNTVILKLMDIGREEVCAAAHRENGFEMADTCDCKPPLPDEDPIPEAYNIEEVFIPPDEDGSEGGVEDGAENAFFLVVPNYLGYSNPISITLEDGAVSPNTEGISVEVNGTDAEIEDGSLKDDITSKAVVIQVPGLAGGSL